MQTITPADRDKATTLAHTDRAAFDTAYDAWLAEDRIDGTPDYTDYFKDSDTLLSETLGDVRVQEIDSLMDEAMSADDMTTYSALEHGLDGLREAYAGAFGDLPK